MSLIPGGIQWPFFHLFGIINTIIGIVGKTHLLTETALIPARNQERMKSVGAFCYLGGS